ncbi:MAG: hypothetical protein HY506_00285 [Candidatus Yanofskybacteria bacterium]|nr:hypothetical protein [Candidatus Yanofskybacteria bacterium]
MENLGFSTGCLYKSGLDLKERLELLGSIGCRTIELGFIRLNEFFDGQLLALTRRDLQSFNYISLHTPKHDYCDDDKTSEIFKTILKFNDRRMLDLVVIHPDTVTDFSIFKANSPLPIAFENMDSRKASYKSAEDMQRLLMHTFSQDCEFGMVLDVNHAYTNDQSLHLTATLWQKFYQWIDQIHLSGFDPQNGYHDPLFKTGQKEIVQSVENANLPIIIESVLDPGELVCERDYILEIFNQT